MICSQTPMWYNRQTRRVRPEKSMDAKILLIDDSQEMTWLLKRALARDDYEVEVAHSGNEGLRQAYAFQPDLILLDIMMPGMDGWEVLHRLREFSDVPVIMLTAVGGADKTVMGLDIGADDYITKPFEIEELKARVRAILRRASLPSSEESRPLRFGGGDLVIDPSSHRVTAGGNLIDLTPTEYKLLLYLAYNAGYVLSADQILANVWGPGYEDSPTNVKVYIRRLRQKIEADPNDPRYILTQWGVGYYLAKT
jgi:DNA-binding response OmpR family regulator